MRLQRNNETVDQPHRDQPIELNAFSILVPEPGYCWLDDATPAPAFGIQNTDNLGCAPYMIVNAFSSEMRARARFPLVETPDLFRRFGDLKLDRESILGFANEHGWIGETGGVRYQKHGWIPAVGISKWHHEIQSMAIALHLWDCVENDDRRTLRKYFTWHTARFDVRLSMGIQQREILAQDHPAIAGSVPGVLPAFLPMRWLIDPHQTEHFHAIGWRKGDVIGPARLAVVNLINPRLEDYCHPRLYLNDRGLPVGHQTPENLLGCIWLQFYLTVIGQLKLRLCTVCKLAMDVSESRSTRRMHDQCAKRERMRRYRKKQRS
jgi:hypothetical protein